MALPVLVWQSTDGDWSNTASWDVSQVPAVDEKPVLPESNSVSVSAGLDQGGIDLDLLQSDKGFVGDIGLSGTPLKIDADKVVHQGSGTLYFYADGDGTNNLVTDWVLIDADSLSNAAELDGDTITRITVLKGDVTIKGSLSVTPTTLEIAHRTNPASDAKVTSNKAVTTITMSAGQCTHAAACTTLMQSGGIFRQNNGAAITTMHIYGGRHFYDSTETIGEANVYSGGILDLTGNSLPKTITTLNVFPGGIVIRNPDLTTITNENVMAGGSLRGSSSDGLGGFGLPI